MLVKSPLQNTV